MSRKPDKVEAMVAKYSQTCKMNGFGMRDDEVVRLLKREHAALVRAVLKEVSSMVSKGLNAPSGVEICACRIRGNPNEPRCWYCEVRQLLTRLQEIAP